MQKRRTVHGVVSRKPGRLQNHYEPWSKTSASQSSQPHRTHPDAHHSMAEPVQESFEAFGLYPDRFDHLHVFSGESELFGLKIFFHMLRVRGAGQRKHPDLHRKSKDDLCETRP